MATGGKLPESSSLMMGVSNGLVSLTSIVHGRGPVPFRWRDESVAIVAGGASDGAMGHIGFGDTAVLLLAVKTASK
jgi:hypothetical protein